MGSVGAAWAVAVAVGVLSACGGAPAAGGGAPAATVLTADAATASAPDAAAAAAPDAATPDAAAPDAAAPAATAAAAPADLVGPPPPVKGQTFTLKQKATGKTKRGLAITYAHHGHKEYAGGGGMLQMITLDVAYDGKTESFEVRSDDDPLEAEVVVFGTLLVITGSYSQVVVTVVAGRAPAPLDDEAAAELAARTGVAAGLPEPSGTGYSDSNGVGEYSATPDSGARWDARVGLYTRRVWFVTARR